MSCPHNYAAPAIMQMTGYICTECHRPMCESCVDGSQQEMRDSPGGPLSRMLCLGCYDRLDRGDVPEDN